MSSSTSYNRAPVAAVVCLGIGVLAGAWGARVGTRALEHARAVQLLSEAALIVCLFCTGLRISTPLDLAAWRVPLRLAIVTLPATVALIAGTANVFLGLPFAQALLLGAVLGPTDPVLVSDLEVRAPDEEQAVRFTLTAEGALSSGFALPLVLFALGVSGHRDLGPLALRWLTLDVIWSLAAGALLGALAGVLGSQALARFGPRNPAGASELGFGEVTLFAALVALVYGASVLVHANGFVAVLAAGTTLARGGAPWVRSAATPRMARALACAAGRVERLAELAMVIVLGALLAVSRVRPALVLFALLVLVAIRPLAARLGLGASGASEPQRRLIAWFGIRGVASLYLVMFCVGEGLSTSVASELIAITLAVLATSIAVHGLTAFPLAKRPIDQRG